MMKRLSITLKSDLCSASGDGFSSGIDIDVCYDKEGLPYIPGRRIKGCLLNAAMEIDVDEATRCALFGSSGRASGCLRVSNAELQGGVQCGSQQLTLDQYTYTRAQTKMNRTSGTALDNTLRYVRVVKHYMTGSDSETCFVARLDVGDEYVEDLMRIAKALRNVGQGRNRGFGAVSCRVDDLLDDTCEKGKVHRTSHDGRTTISYRVGLKSPVMLPQQNGKRSASYIPGLSVLGCLASKMSKRDDFEKVFLSGKVRFSPLYPVDRERNRCLPCAPFVVKVKGGIRDGQYLCSYEFEPGSLESAKPLKDGFMSPASWEPVEVNTDINYHHSTGVDATLYTQECLSQGQSLAGFVECPDEMADDIEEALCNGGLSFGRSKTAQYSQCVLEECDDDYGMAGETVDVIKGHSYALLLDSDVLLLDQGVYTTRYEDLERSIRSECGDWFKGSDITLGPLDGEHPRPLVTSVAYRKITGYNAKWGHKRPHVTAFAAGSCIGFTASSSREGVPTVMYVGERQAEGFGRVVLVDCSEVDPTHEVGQDTEMGVTTREGCRRIAVSIADSNRIRLFQVRGRFSPSFVSRLSRMVQESQDSQDLNLRVQSVKEADRRAAAERLVKEVRERVLERLGHEDWGIEQECLGLVLTLGKYYQMQACASEGSR